MQDLMSLLKKRRSVRRYKTEQITDEELRQVIEAGRLAPSGSNSQTAHFVVVQNGAVLDELRALVQAEFAGMELTDDLYSSMKTSIRLSRQGRYNFMYNPPTFIIAANKRGYGNAMADCAAALQNMMLMAADLGLGTCWINQLKWLADNDNVKAYLAGLGIDETEQVCGCLALGYSDQGELPPVIIKGNRYEVIK